MESGTILWEHAWFVEENTHKLKFFFTEDPHIWREEKRTLVSLRRFWKKLIEEQHTEKFILKSVLGLWKREMKFSQLKPSKILSVRNPSQYFTRFWDGIVFFKKSVQNSWEKTSLNMSSNFHTILGRKFCSVKTVPNPFEKVRQIRIRPKISSKIIVFLVV